PCHAEMPILRKSLTRIGPCRSQTAPSTTPSPTAMRSICIRSTAPTAAASPSRSAPTSLAPTALVALPYVRVAETPPCAERHAEVHRRVDCRSRTANGAHDRDRGVQASVPHLCVRSVPVGRQLGAASVAATQDREQALGVGGRLHHRRFGGHHGLFVRVEPCIDVQIVARDRRKGTESLVALRAQSV